MEIDKLKEYLAKISLPPAELNITREKGVLKIFDPLRKKRLVLTPEELVRQIFVNWLLTHKGYPASLISNEIGIKVNGTKKRCDTVVFNPKGNPLVVIEYKSPEISISQEVFNQIIRYNSVLRSPFLVVSNGSMHYCCRMDYINHNHIFKNDVPFFTELSDFY